MTSRLLLALFMFASVCGAAYAQGGDGPPPLGPGVSRELARWRAARYRQLSYALDVTLTPGAPLLKGKVAVRVTLDAPAELVLDWRMTEPGVAARERVSDIRVNGRPVEDARVADEHILIPRSHLRAGENTVEMSFASPVSASGSAVTRYLDREDNSEYVYTLFVPSDASTAFPCFDQPDLKAHFRLALTVPNEWKAVSNSDVVDWELIEQAGRPALRRVVFDATHRISTYVFAFAAGPFAEFDEAGRLAPAEPPPHTASPPLTSPEAARTFEEASKAATEAAPPMRIFVRKSKAEAARRELAEVFRINREGVRFFEDYFARRFPFTKYDLVIIPEFPFGGMEHAGATFLREEAIIFPSDPTAGDLWARADVLLHEAAHQWFGDLVTMEWFDDLWLKEGFATFMSSKAVAKILPQFDAWKVFYLRTKPPAYQTDATKGTTPIWQEIANLSAAKSAYGNIVYRKAPSILRQAEFYLGEREFRDAVRLFVSEHAYANAEWSDLVRAFERTSSKKLGAWADAWVRRRGMPDVRVEWATDRRGRISRLSIQQSDVLGEGGAWPMKIEVVLRYQGAGGASNVTLPVTLDGRRVTHVREAVGRPAPDFVFANHGDYGYGRFLLDERSRAAVVEKLDEIPSTDFLRALLWGALWESVRDAEMAPADFVGLVIKHAPDEYDDVTLQFLLARAQTAFTRYLSATQTLALAPRLEAMLRDGMTKSETAALRITYFRTFRDVAVTAEGRQELIRILSGESSVPGMTLRARDRFDIARALMSGGDGRAPDILKRLGEEERSDDARRYAYAAGAAWPDDAVKRRYFEEFLRKRDLSESWIEASLGPLNAPRQDALTLPLLAPALRQLPELKRTRKIFFVNGWLAAFIGGQCGERAAVAVRDFLAASPELDRDLRLKVLEAADGLDRCVRIRARHASETPAAGRAP